VSRNCPGASTASTARRTWFHSAGSTCHSSSSTVEAASCNDLHPCAKSRPVGRAQHCRPFVTWRTLIGGPAYQTRNGSDLCELLVIASNLIGAFRLPPAFRRPKRRRRGVLCGSAENLFDLPLKHLSQWRDSLNRYFPMASQEIALHGSIGQAGYLAEVVW